MRRTAKGCGITVFDLAAVERKDSIADLDRAADRKEFVHLFAIRIGLIVVILQDRAAAKGQLRLCPGQDQGSAGLHAAVRRASLQDVVHSAGPVRAAVQRDILYRQVGAITQGDKLIAVSAPAVHAVSAAVQRQLFARYLDCLRDGHILAELYGASVRRVRNGLCQTAVAGTVYDGHKAAHLDLCGGRQDLVACLPLAIHQIGGCGVASCFRGQIACTVRAGDHGFFTVFAQLVPAVSDGMRPRCRLNGQRLDRVVLPVGRALGRDEHGNGRETHLHLEGGCQVRSPYCGSHGLLSGHRRVIPAERHILRLQAAAVLHDQVDLQAGIVQHLAQEVARFLRRRQAHLLHLCLQSGHRISRNGRVCCSDELGCQIDQSAGDRRERPGLHRQAIQRGIACHVHIFQVRAGGECVLADVRHRFGDGNAVHAAACSRKRIGRNARYGIGHAAHRHRLRDLRQRAAAPQRGVIGGEDALRRALHRLKAEGAAGDVLQNGDVQLCIDCRLVLQREAQRLAARRLTQRLYAADGSSVYHRERIFVRRQRLFAAVRPYLLDRQVGQVQRVAKEILRFYIRALLQL